MCKSISLPLAIEETLFQEFIIIGEYLLYLIGNKHLNDTEMKLEIRYTNNLIREETQDEWINRYCIDAGEIRSGNIAKYLYFPWYKQSACIVLIKIIPEYSIDITIKPGYNYKKIKKEYFQANISDIFSIKAKTKVQRKCYSMFDGMSMCWG